jgi:hypothetical protein
MLLTAVAADAIPSVISKVITPITQYIGLYSFHSDSAFGHA